MNTLKELFEVLLLLQLFAILMPIILWTKRPRHFWHKFKTERKEKKETRQSLEELGYPHSGHYAYIASTTPLWVRLHLSKYRGNRKAITWRIKLLKLLNIVGPRTAEMLLEEYMITAESSAQPAPTDSWACPKCGTKNPETALFCKDCGEYK